MRVMLPGALAYERRRYRIYPADAEQARVKLTAALDRIIAELKPSGYLVGESFSVADLAATLALAGSPTGGRLRAGAPGPPPVVGAGRRCVLHVSGCGRG